MKKQRLWNRIAAGGTVDIEDLKRDTGMSKTAILDILNEWEDAGLVSLEVE